MSSLEVLDDDVPLVGVDGFEVEGVGGDGCVALDALKPGDAGAGASAAQGDDLGGHAVGEVDVDLEPAELAGQGSAFPGSKPDAARVGGGLDAHLVLRGVGRIDRDHIELRADFILALAYRQRERAFAEL